MKNNLSRVILFFCFFLFVFAFRTFSGVNSITVLATTNGVLLAPTNIFPANIAALTNALNSAGYSAGGGGAGGLATNVYLQNGGTNLVIITNSPGNWTINTGTNVLLNGSFTGNFLGYGGGVTGIYSSSIVGTVAGALLANTASYATNAGSATNITGATGSGLNVAGNFSGNFGGSGALLVGIPGSSIESGVLLATNAQNATNIYGAGLLTMTNASLTVFTNSIANSNSYNGSFSGSGAGLTNLLSTNLVDDRTIISVTTNSTDWPWYHSDTNFTFYGSDSMMTNFTLYGTPTSIPMQIDGNRAARPPFYIHGASGVCAFPAEAGYGFTIDGNTMQLSMEDQGFQWLVMVNGRISYIAPQMPSDGALVTFNINFNGSARKNIVIFGGWGLVGVVIPSTNSFIPLTPTPLAHKTVIYGDSYVGQAYVPTAPLFGLVSQLQYQRMDLDVIGIGIGGSGYVQPGTANGITGTNFPNHLQDIVTNNPENVIIFGGINDQSWCTNTDPTNIFYVNATNTLLSLRRMLPNANVFVIGPQIPNAPTIPAYQSYWNEAQMLSNACLLANYSYTDPLLEPWITGSTSSGGAIGNAWQYIQFSDNTHPTIPLGASYFASQINGVISSNTSPLTPFDIRNVNLTGLFNGNFTGNGAGLTNVASTNIITDSRVLSPTSNQTNYTVNLRPGEISNEQIIYLQNTNAWITFTGTNVADDVRGVFFNAFTDSIPSTVLLNLPGFHTNSTFSIWVTNGFGGYFTFYNLDSTGTNLSAIDDGRIQ